MVSLDNLPKSERPNLKAETILSYPSIEKIIDHYFEKQSKSRFAIMATYLLRDTLKVIGSKELILKRATLGIFYVNPEKPISGGTSHKIRVCKQNNIPVLRQEDWL